MSVQFSVYVYPLISYIFKTKWFILSLSSKYFMFSGLAILTIHYNFLVVSAEFFRVTLRQVTACVRPELAILFCLQQVCS